MTDPSPAQKAVAAFNERYELCGPFDVDWVEQCLAAALEAVADEVAPFEKAPDLVPAYGRNSFVRRLDFERLAQRQHTRTRLLAIAAELRDNTITTENN